MQHSLHQQQRLPSQQVGKRGRVARFEQPPLVLDNKPINIRVGGEDGRIAEDVGGEEGAKAGDARVSEGLGVGGLVGGDELEGLAEEGEAEGSRREAAHEQGAAEEENEYGGDEERDKNGEEVHHW